MLEFRQMPTDDLIITKVIKV